MTDLEIARSVAHKHIFEVAQGWAFIQTISCRSDATKPRSPSTLPSGYTIDRLDGTSW